MKHAISRHNLFTPGRTKAATRADLTDSSARAITAGEAALRTNKTALLRQLRLDKAAVEATSVNTTKAPQKTPRRSRTKTS
jgi:hypothetical protein